MPRECLAFRFRMVQVCVRGRFIHETGAHCDRAGLTSRCSSRCWQRHGQGLARDEQPSRQCHSSTSADTPLCLLHMQAVMSKHALVSVLALFAWCGVVHSSPPDLLVGRGPRPDTESASGWARHPGRDWHVLPKTIALYRFAPCCWIRTTSRNKDRSPLALRGTQHELGHHEHLWHGHRCL